MNLATVSILVALGAIFCVINLLVNISVIVVTLKSRKLKDDPVTHILRSLALSDIGLGAVIPLISVSVAGLALATGFPVSVTFPNPVYAVFNCLFGAFGSSSVLHLGLVAVVKCSVIVWPFAYFNRFTDRSMKILLVGVWFISFIIGFIPMMLGTEYQIDWDSIVAIPSTLPLANFPKHFKSIVVSLSVFFLCTFMIFVFYTKIYLVVRQHLRHVGDSQPQSMSQPHPNGDFMAGVRSSKNHFIITLVYLFTYVPVICYLFVLTSGVLRTNPSALATATYFKAPTTWFYISSSIWNGGLYILLHRSIRKELWLIITRWQSLIPA